MRANLVSLRKRIEMKTPFTVLFYCDENSRAMIETGIEDSRSTTNQLLR